MIFLNSISLHTGSFKEKKAVALFAFQSCVLSARGSINILLKEHLVQILWAITAILVHVSELNGTSRVSLSTA